LRASSAARNSSTFDRLRSIQWEKLLQILKNIAIHSYVANVILFHVRGKVDETIITRKILEFSEFKRFYHVEWEPRKTSVSIEWNINPSCSNFAASKIDADGVPQIELKHLPKTFDDAFLAAHEIVHIIRDLDNKIIRFPCVNNIILQRYTIDAMDDLASRIGSMFDDPIVDMFLQKEYGFAPAYHYIKEVIPDSLRRLDSLGDATDELIRLTNAMFYAQYSLQVEAIKNKEASRKWSVLKKRYKERRPIAQKIGEDLYSMAKENGYDTLDKQKSLFNMIGDKYTLAGIKIKDVLDVE
jgi:hypothetical protein